MTIGPLDAFVSQEQHETIGFNEVFTGARLDLELVPVNCWRLLAKWDRNLLEGSMLVGGTTGLL